MSTEEQFRHKIVELKKAGLRVNSTVYVDEKRAIVKQVGDHHVVVIISDNGHLRSQTVSPFKIKFDVS